MIAIEHAERLAAAIESEDWRGVATLLTDSRQPGDVWLRTFARNAASLRVHRPSIYRATKAAADANASALAGEPHDRTEPDRLTAEVFNSLETIRKNARSCAIAGLGDGSLVAAMAKFAPDLILGRQQNIFLIEPDLSRLLDSLGQRDLTGPRGPIEQRRFDWYIGDGWADALFSDLAADATKLPPARTVHGGAPRPEVEAAVAAIETRWTACTDQRQRDVNAYYDALTDGELLSVFGPMPPRRPRVMMLTSQFTAVLQFSTNDSADAMRQLGWDVRVCTETQMWHLMAKPAVVAALAEFKPDLIFQIDHLRYELGEIVPANLPFVCWIQDHLTNLTTTNAGRSIGPRDFVLTGGTYRYVNRYDYPRRQCIDTPKVSRAPALPAAWEHDREDIFYVSHWSHTPEAIILEVCGRVRELAGPEAEAMMRDCAAAMNRVYGEGNALRLDAEVRGLVRDVVARRRAEMNAETERFFVDVLFQRLNNAYFRQQALTWTGQIADELGLKFGIYGVGWEKHPTLGCWARGPIMYGPALEDLTRRSKIILQLEPYPCFMHQRMLDGLLAGGFALIRENPLNVLPITVRKFLDAHVPPDVNSVDEARDCLSGSELEQFDALLASCGSLADLGDVVDIVRGWQRAGTIGNDDAALPHLDEIGFDSFETLRARIVRFIDDADARERIAADQRHCVNERLTYVAALGRAVRVMHERLGESVAASDPLIHPALEAA